MRPGWWVAKQAHTLEYGKTVYSSEHKDRVRPALADKGAVHDIGDCFHHVVDLDLVPGTTIESSSGFLLAIKTCLTDGSGCRREMHFWQPKCHTRIRLRSPKGGRVRVCKEAGRLLWFLLKRGRGWKDLLENRKRAH